LSILHSNILNRSGLADFSRSGGLRHWVLRNIMGNTGIGVYRSKVTEEDLVERDRIKPIWFRRLLLLDQMVDRGLWRRASGECTCRVCGRIYYKHPYIEDLALNLLCDGTLVHL
jgi:hypothetical protein